MDSSRRFAGRPTVSTALFVGVPLLLLGTSLKPGTFLYGDDYVTSFYYLRGLVADFFRSGTLPHWTSSVECGSPLLAVLHAAVLYPPSWLCLVLDPGPFWTVTVWIHLSLAGIFTRLWLRRGLGMSPVASAAGAGVVLLSGFLAGHVHAGHVPHVCAFPWAAAVLWRLERQLAAPTLRRTCSLAICLAVMILAGFPQFVFILLFAIAARLGYEAFRGEGDRKQRRGRILAAAAGLLLGALAAAPQLLPTLELIPRAQRVASRDPAFAGSYAMPPEQLFGLVVPTFFGHPEHGFYWGRWFLWETTGFVGIAGLLLAAVGLTGTDRRRFFWAGVALLGVLLALGPSTPVYRIARVVVPGMGSFRAPGRFLLLFTLFMAPLVASGLQRLEKWKEGDARSLRGPFLLAAALLACLAAGTILMELPGGGDSPLWKGILNLTRGREGRVFGTIADMAGHRQLAFDTARAGLRQATVMAGLALLAFLLARRETSARAPIVAALVFLLWGELLAFSDRFYRPTPEAIVSPAPELAALAEEQRVDPFRVASGGPRAAAMIGRCQQAGLDHVGGYDPLLLREYTQLLNASQQRDPDEVPTLMCPQSRHPILRMLGVRYWTGPGDRAGLVPVGSGPMLYRDPAALPRAFRVARAVVLPSPAERLRHLAAMDFDPARAVILEDSADAGKDGGDPGRTTLKDRGPGRYRFETEGGSAAWLVLSEAHYPGWEARVDGQAVPLLRANHFIQAVRVPAGRHDVEFRYRSRTFPAGCGIALLAVLLPAGLLLRARLRR